MALSLIAGGLAAVPAFAKDGNGEHEKKGHHETAGVIDAQLATAGVVTKAAAEQIALAAVGNGTVVAALFEHNDHVLHWSVDIVGAANEYEVWVGTSGKVLKIITQPR